MDCAATIARRLAAMKELYDAGVQTVCQMAPIFPGVTDVKAIIGAVKDRCNLVWLENLNLRGDYMARILQCIHANRPELDGLYHAIYTRNDRSYWAELDESLREFTAREGFNYLRDDDTQRAPFGQPPVVVNYFFHEQIIPSAKKAQGCK